MLRDRAQRLLAGDVAGYLAPLEAAARATEEPIARGATAVPLTSVDLVLTSGTPGAEGEYRDASVDFLYRYRRLPANNVFRFRMTYRIETREGTPVVLSSALDPALPLPIWATGPVEVQRSPHFLVLSRPGLGIGRLLDTAEQAQADLLPKLTIEPDPVHLLVLARDDHEYAGLLGQAPATEGTTAISLAVARAYYAGRGPEARDMVVNVAAVFGPTSVPYEGRSSVTPAEVFQHELGHLALLRFNSALTPGWVIEGAAMYLSGEQRRDSWREDLQSGFAGLSIATLDETDLPAEAYAYANAAVLYLVEQFGADKFWDFYQHIRRNGLERTLRLLYDLDERQLDDRVRAWIRRNV